MREMAKGRGFFKSLFGKVFLGFGRLPVSLLLFAIILTTLATTAHAQATPGLSPDQNVIEMDIRTSTLSELAAWSRRNGLPEGGTAADLARRLREHYGLPPEGQVTAREGQRIITIESARVQEVFTIYVVDEEYARLSGDVVISLRDGDATHEIQAWDILFNRTRNIISASGGVRYRRVQGDTIETFRGDSIIVDLDNWASVFLGGISERTMEGEGTTYLFAGTIISRDEEETTVLRDATISSVGEESLWSLTASRVWLLPGADFAILNAVLRVGHIPVFYIPFFFFPADQMLFHPSIGSRPREGNFINTTTWLLGRPRVEGSSESSLMSIMGGAGDMDRTREGMFLRSTGRRAEPDAGPSLSLLLDFYTNLGGYIGTEMTLPGRGIFGTTSISMGIGLSRTLVNVAGVGYTPYAPNFDGETDWNYSRLFGTRVPFRYRLDASGSMSGRLGNLNWRFPFYSDPLIDSDFMNRSMDMDWLNMLRQGAISTDEQTTTRTHLGNPVWELTGNVRPTFPDMRPFINTLSIGQMRSTLVFRSIETTLPPVSPDMPATDPRRHTPMRFFFAPETSTLFTTSLSLAGRPLHLGGGGATQAGAAAPAQPEPENPLEGIGVPISPFAVPEPDDPPPPRDPTDTLVPPVLAQRFDLPRTGRGNTSISLDYRFDPTGTSFLRFDTRNWNEFDAVEWGDVMYVTTSVEGTARIGLNFNFFDNFFRHTFSLDGRGHWRQLSYLNEEAEEFVRGSDDPDEIAGRLAAFRHREYQRKSFSTTYTLTTNFQPFHRHPVFGASNVQHSLGGLAVRSRFASTVEDLQAGYDPEWELEFGEWNRERITNHRLTTNIQARIMDRNQSLTFITELPPRDELYRLSATFNVWITTTTASWGILFPENQPYRHEPFSLTHRITFPDGFGNFNQTLRVDTMERELTQLHSTLNLTRWGLTATFRADHLRPREFILDGPWGYWRNARDEDGNEIDPAIIPRDFQLQYGRTIRLSPRNDIVDNFIVTVNTGTTFDLREYTNSRLTFSIASTLNMRFLTLRLSAESVNDEIFRYFKNWPMFRGFPGSHLMEGRQNNLFLDLVNSFRFDNRELREASGFKIRNLRIGAERALGDWTASLTWHMDPHRPAGATQFEMANTITFLVRWIPISEFRSEIRYDGRAREGFPRWQVQGL